MASLRFKRMNYATLSDAFCELVTVNSRRSAQRPWETTETCDREHSGLHVLYPCIELNPAAAQTGTISPRRFAKTGRAQSSCRNVTSWTTFPLYASQIASRWYRFFIARPGLVRIPTFRGNDSFHCIFGPCDSVVLTNLLTARCANFVSNSEHSD